MASKSDIQTHKTDALEESSHPVDDVPVDRTTLENTTKSRWERSWPTIACGAGLFSDGYLNGVRISCSPCVVPF